MREIVLCRLENWREDRGESIIGKKGKECTMAAEKEKCAVTGRPYVIVGSPCSELLELQAAGHCVLAELAHLQGLSEEEVAEALCEEEAVQQFENVCINAAELPQAYLRRIWCRSQGQSVLIAETERLIIRESSVEDAEAFWKLYQDAECRKYLEALPVEADAESGVDQLRDAYRRYIVDYQNGQYAFFEYGMWTVVEKESGAVVGRVGLELQEAAVDGGKEPRLQEVTVDGGKGSKLQKVAVDGGKEPKPQEVAVDGGKEPKPPETAVGSRTESGEPAGGDQESILGLGYAVLPQFRGKGYAVEACQAILKYCKECEYADKVYVKVDVRNVASRKVFEKIKEHSCIKLELVLG